MRKIYLHGEVNESMYTKFSIELDALVASSPDPIYIDLHSHGGEAASGLAIYGRIRACPCLIYTEAYGTASSAATIILAGSDFRSMGLDTWFMVHDNPTKPKKHERTQYEREEQQWAEILELHSLLPASEWRKMSKKTTYLNPAQCLQYGIVDAIMKGNKNAK